MSFSLSLFSFSVHFHLFHLFLSAIKFDIAHAQSARQRYDIYSLTVLRPLQHSALTPLPWPHSTSTLSTTLLVYFMCIASAKHYQKSLTTNLILLKRAPLKHCHAPHCRAIPLSLSLYLSFFFSFVISLIIRISLEVVG